MNLFKPFKKVGFELFIYFLKGAHIAAALQFRSRARVPTGFAFPKEGATPVEQNANSIVWDATDMIREFRMTTRATLILKNNSKNHAYNVSLLNEKEIFDYCDSIPKLTSLAPNANLELKIEFIQTVHVPTGIDADETPLMPVDKENKILKIQYENESGTKFLTKFWVTFSKIYNEYTYA